MATYTIDKIQYNNGDTYLLQDSGALQLTGGSITGPVNFGDSVTMNEATLSELTISGAATIVNNLQVSSINGVAVGNTPKFTDTTYSSLTAASGGTSVSLVTTGEKYTWNNKTSNAGTVTSVRVQASTPLVSSTSTATTTTLDTTISFAKQSANTVLAGPSSGTTTVAPTFRALVTNDLPHDTEILNTATDNKVPTSLAVKKSLGYVTPQMFGAYADGTSSNPHDDTDAIQAALDASLEVYFPPGVYMVSSTLNIPNKAHIWGNAGDSKIRAANTFNGSFIAQVAVYDSSGLPQATRFCIEKLEFSCNNVSVGGLYLVRPYNSCIVRDILITNCPKTAIWVGDTRLNSNNTAYILTTSQSRSQSLLIENCYCDASSSIAPTGPLGYFYNCFELNLKDTKFLFKNGNLSSYPCVSFDYCYDFYVRGCSFQRTTKEAVSIVRNCRYFRLIGNTYEDVAYQTTNPAIKCNGYSTYGVGGSILQGIIIENAYYNVSRKIEVTNSQYIMILGSFSEVTKSLSDNITLYNMLEGGNIARESFV